MLYSEICTENICRLLRANDQSVRQLALAVEVSPSTMADALKSQKGVSIDLLVRIAAFFNVSIGALCSKNLIEKAATEGTLLKKYAALDEHGKELIQLVLDKELQRCTQADASFAAAARVGQPSAGSLSAEETARGLAALDRLAAEGPNDNL